MKIEKKKVWSWQTDISISILPKLPISTSWANTKNLLFGFSTFDKHTVLLLDMYRIKTPLSNLTSINVVCACCDKTLFSIDKSNLKNERYCSGGMASYTPANASFIERRFVNINKRSAKFMIPFCKGCDTIFELNPLPYLEKLEKIAKFFDNTKIVVEK